MKVILKDANNYILRFDKGEEVFTKLGEFMQSEQLGACSFNAIGACSEAEVGYYNDHLKDYRKKPFYEELEIISLMGNISMVEGKPFTHAHGMFGRTDFSTIGGHVFKILVSVTCEMHLTRLEGIMQRKNSEELNLKLLE